MVACFAAILDCVCRDSGVKKVARGASAFCEHPWLSSSIQVVPRQRHWITKRRCIAISSAADAAQNDVPLYQGLLAKGARTPGYLLLPLSRRVVVGLSLCVCPPPPTPTPRITNLQLPHAPHRHQHRRPPVRFDCRGPEAAVRRLCDSCGDPP